MRALIVAAVQLLGAAVACDAVLTMLDYLDHRGRRTTVWRSDGNLLTEKFVQSRISGSRDLCILAARAKDNFPFFVPFVEGVPMQHSVVLFFWNETRDTIDLLLAPHRRSTNIAASEMSLLHELYPHIETALRRVSRLHQSMFKCLGLEDFISMLPLPAILLDWELAPLYCNRAGCRAAALWNGSDPLLKLSTREFKVPEDLLDVVEEIRIRQTLGSLNFRERVVSHPRLPRLKAHVSIRKPRSPSCRTAIFVICFETEVGQEGNLARFARLSPKERELALMVNEGKSNQEIADTLGRQLNTVKSELHSIFKKLGIPSRARLMALLR